MMNIIPVSNIESYKRLSSVIKKHMGVKLSLVLDNLAKSFGHHDYHAVMKFAAQRGSAQLSDSSLSMTEGNVEVWVKQLEFVFGSDVLPVFDKRSPDKWYVSICALKQAPTNLDIIEVSIEESSGHLVPAPEVSKLPPTVIYKKRRKAEIPK